MINIAKLQRQYSYPLKIIQFGEGNFLRAFWDKAIHELNTSALFQGQICVVQPLPIGNLELLARQNFLYHTLLQDGEEEELILVESIKEGINPYKDFEGFRNLALNPDIKFIISNTTEAGIILDEHDSIHKSPPDSFPGKLLVLLHCRYTVFHGETGSGFHIIPCELVDNNGEQLSAILEKLSILNNLGEKFIQWLREENIFYNTLVDGIVTGYPEKDIPELEKRLGCKDEALVKGEKYQLLMIEKKGGFGRDLPIERAALEVLFTEDLSKHRNMKVRILNGFQTILALCGYLGGLNTVRQALDDAALNKMMKSGLWKEILPSLPYPLQDSEAFAKQVLIRLDNPHIEHRLLDINLNAWSKYQSRLQPSMESWLSEVPVFLIFGLALLIHYYRIVVKRDAAYFGISKTGYYPLYDTEERLHTLKKIWDQYREDQWNTEQLCEKIFQSKKLWTKIPVLSDEGWKMLVNYLSILNNEEWISPVDVFHSAYPTDRIHSR